MSLMISVTNQVYNIYVKYHRCLMYLKLFNQLDELLLLFKFLKYFSLMISYGNDVFLPYSNYLLILFDDGGGILAVL